MLLQLPHLCSYGSKSNEELLFLYGFALQDNPADVLTSGCQSATAGSQERSCCGLLHARNTPGAALLLLLSPLPTALPFLPPAVMCPLPPPEQWDEALEGRLRLLAARGRRPQFFLTAAELKALATGGGGGGSGGGGASWWRPWTWGRRSGSVAAAATAAAAPDLPLPEGVVDTLEVFMMDLPQLSAELDALDAGGEGRGGAAATAAAAAAAGVSAAVEAAGLRLAVLTTLARLLELKSAAMEGEEDGEDEAGGRGGACGTYGAAGLERCWAGSGAATDGAVPARPPACLPLPLLCRHRTPGGGRGAAGSRRPGAACQPTTCAAVPHGPGEAAAAAVRCFLRLLPRALFVHPARSYRPPSPCRNGWRGGTWRMPAHCCSQRWSAWHSCRAWARRQGEASEASRADCSVSRWHCKCFTCNDRGRTNRNRRENRSVQVTGKVKKGLLHETQAIQPGI